MAARPYPLVRIGFQAYNQPTLNAFTKFARDTALDNLALTGTTHVRPMPTKVKRWTVLKSPHVNKTAREQFERRTYRQQIAIHSHLTVADGTLSAEQLAKEKAREAEAAQVWVDYLRESCPPGVGLNVVSWRETTVSPKADLQLDAIPHAALPDATAPSAPIESTPPLASTNVIEEEQGETEEKPKRRRAATKKATKDNTTTETTGDVKEEKPKRAPRKTSKQSETPSS